VVKKFLIYEHLAK